MEKISIIIPTYNSAIYLNRCIKSILNQTYKNIEIIIVDDGSNDETENFVKENYYDLKNVKYIKQHNSGVSVARNKGIKIANGKFIFFIDADDTIDKFAIENLIKEYDDTCLIGLNHCICKGKKVVKRKYKKKIYDSKEFLKSIFRGECLGVVWGYLFETKWLKNIYFDENTFYIEDTIFLIDFFKFSKIKKVKFIDEDNYYNYYINKGSITTSSKNIQKKCSCINYSLKKINEKTENKYKNLIDINLLTLLEKEMRFCKNTNEFEEIYKTIGKLNCTSNNIQIRIFVKLYNKKNFHILKLYYFIRNSIKKIY